MPTFGARTTNLTSDRSDPARTTAKLALEPDLLDAPESRGIQWAFHNNMGGSINGVLLWDLFNHESLYNKWGFHNNIPISIQIIHFWLGCSIINHKNDGKWLVDYGKSQSKMDDLGVPPFTETPIYNIFFVIPVLFRIFLSRHDVQKIWCHLSAHILLRLF